MPENASNTSSLSKQIEGDRKSQHLESTSLGTMQKICSLQALEVWKARFQTAAHIKSQTETSNQYESIMQKTQPTKRIHARLL